MEPQKEIQIPVFSVWKNNAILKNIFLVNSPPSIYPSHTHQQNDEIHQPHLEFEETLIVGRHPDSDIRLEHPSISRFHLRIHSKPSSNHLYLTDLSSVHGTWVSGKRIEPNIRIRMNENDTLRIGGSSRVYKLHWIPLSQAYDVSNPFVPPLGFVQPLEDEDEGIGKNENPLEMENEEVQGVDSVSMGLEFSVLCDDDRLVIKQVAQKTEEVMAVENECVELKGPDLEGLMSVSVDKKAEVFGQDLEVNENFQPLDSALEGLVPLFMGERWEWIGQEGNYMAFATDEHLQSMKLEDMGSADSVLEGLDTLDLDNNIEQLVQNEIATVPSVLEDVASPNLGKTTAGGIESEFVSKMSHIENEIPLQEENIRDGVWNFWCGSHIAPILSLPSAIKGVLPSTKNNLLDIEKPISENESEPRILSERKGLGSVNFCQNSSIEDNNGTKLWSFWSGNMGVESSVCSSFSDASFSSESENKSTRNGFESPPISSIERPFGSPLILSDQKSASSIWSRTCKLQSAPQISKSMSERKKTKNDPKNVKHESVSRALFREVESQEEAEIFTPDTENFTPTTHSSMRKLAMLKEVYNSSSGKSSLLNMIGSPKIYYEDMSPLSNKENYSPRITLEKKTSWRASVNQVKSVGKKEKKGEMMPFQSLLTDSPQNIISETFFPGAAKVMSKTTTPNKCSGEKTRKWSMLVDTTTLLNRESRKALQLLEGVKGTQLIIPKIVIKDLTCFKRQTSFFRRNTEVSSALGWIEECMVKTQWWIHVQNSTEEGRPVAPTPPASPYSQVSCGTSSSFALSVLEFQPELLSPCIEDHVLDYALSFRRNKNDGQLVLLSNDVTLKIKAMAEGIICETAEDFRQSLVNPFSERFLWTDSSPRGQTWSYSDHSVLRENFYPSSLKLTPKAIENVKGLKLILLCNSQYFERMTACH